MFYIVAVVFLLLGGYLGIASDLKEIVWPLTLVVVAAFCAAAKTHSNQEKLIEKLEDLYFKDVPDVDEISEKEKAQK